MLRPKNRLFYFMKLYYTSAMGKALLGGRSKNTVRKVSGIFLCFAASSRYSPFLMLPFSVRMTFEILVR